MFDVITGSAGVSRARWARSTNRTFVKRITMLRACGALRAGRPRSQVIRIDNALWRFYSACVRPKAGSSTDLTEFNAPNSRHAYKIMAQEDVSSAQSDSGLSSAENSGRACVLLAEDDRALRRFLVVLLERAGYKVISASDGIEAMKIVVSQPIDVIITDSMMPNLNGHEFCRFIRSSQKLAHLPIILLSALERKETNQNVEQADAFLAKPVSGEDLIECIERLLKRKSGSK